MTIIDSVELDDYVLVTGGKHKGKRGTLKRLQGGIRPLAVIVSDQQNTFKAGVSNLLAIEPPTPTRTVDPVTPQHGEPEVTANDANDLSRLLHDLSLQSSAMIMMSDDPTESWSKFKDTVEEKLSHATRRH